MNGNFSPGLEGVTAGETAISTVGKKGLGLSYSATTYHLCGIPTAAPVFVFAPRGGVA